MLKFRSGKIFTHAQGLSCAFRQWRTDTHCAQIHGYSLQIEMTFERVDSSLDNRMWVMGFGDLKPIKQWLAEAFDHKMLVAKDDPELSNLLALKENKLANIVIVDNVGVESFCKLVYDYTSHYLKNNHPDVNLNEIKIREHEGNWASYGI